MERLKLQISIETLLILVIIIAIALLSIFIMFKIFPHNNEYYMREITLYQASVNATHLTLYLSGEIPNPTSIVLTYFPISNSLQINTFSLNNCNYTTSSSNLFAYTFTATPSCNFNAFQGVYLIKQATYRYDGTNIALVMNNELPIGYTTTNQLIYATLTVIPNITTIGSNVNTVITTDVSNSLYSIFIGNYAINKCTAKPTTSTCQFNLNSSIGVDTPNTFYTIHAYVFNTTENVEANATIYVS